jgi:hypothetical protein
VSILRLGLDGALDSRLSAVANGFVNQIAEQSDKKVLVAGSFTSVNATPRGSIARLMPDSRPPELITLTATSVAENQPVDTVIGNLRVVGAAPGASYSFEIVSGANPDGIFLFGISGDELRTVGALDYERQHLYSIRVRATTPTHESIEQTLVIGIIDVPEGPGLTGRGAAVGAPGSFFSFTISGFTSNSRVSVALRRVGALALAAAPGDPLGTVVADSRGTALATIFFAQTALAGSYEVSASDGAVSAALSVTIDPQAPLLPNPGDAPVLNGQHTIYLPLIRR